jgi:hypothetical protein
LRPAWAKSETLLYSSVISATPEDEVRGSWFKSKTGQKHNFLSENQTKSRRTGGMAQVVECLEALSSNPIERERERARDFHGELREGVPSLIWFCFILSMAPLPSEFCYLWFLIPILCLHLWPCYDPSLSYYCSHMVELRIILTIFKIKKSHGILGISVVLFALNGSIISI